MAASFELVDLEGEVLRHQRYVLHRGRNDLVVANLANLLPGSYGYRLSWPGGAPQTGVITRQ